MAQPATRLPCTGTDTSIRVSSPSSFSATGMSWLNELKLKFQPQPRILGGRNAFINGFPYQVSLRRRGTCYGHGHIGAASILNEQYLLTAAHCLDTPEVPSLYYVVAGSTKLDSGKSFNVEKITIHDKYSKKNPYQFDVAVIQLQNPLIFGSTIHPISLVDIGEEPPVGTKVVVAGWGRTIPENTHPELNYSDLKEIELQITDRDLCSLRGVGKISPIVLCAGSDSKEKTDASVGDSGGPLVDIKTRKQVGIVSFGSEKATTRCPGAYTNLAHEDIRTFIDHVLSG